MEEKPIINIPRDVWNTLTYFCKPKYHYLVTYKQRYSENFSESIDLKKAIEQRLNTLPRPNKYIWVEVCFSEISGLRILKINPIYAGFGYVVDKCDSGEEKTIGIIYIKRVENYEFSPCIYATCLTKERADSIVEKAEIEHKYLTFYVKKLEFK
jgi:hypothetical protein